MPACRERHGSWWWRADAGRDPVTGKRLQRTGSGYATRTEAQDELTEFLGRLASGTVTSDRGLTVARWLETWLAEGKARWEVKTYSAYASDVHGHLIPLIGHIRLRDLRRAHVESMLTLLGDPASKASAGVQRAPRTLDRIRRTLRAALGVAVRRSMIATNPAEGRMESIPKRGSKTSASWWQPEQLLVFLQHVQSDALVALWTIAALAGLRRSELCGLRWVDLDLDADQPGLTVRQRVVEINGDRPCPRCAKGHPGREIRGGAKTSAGDERWVPLTRDSVDALKAHRARQAARKLAVGEHWADHGLVFAEMEGDHIGGPRRPETVTDAFQRLSGELKLPRIRLHDMRHGAVSLLAAAGLPLELIALIVGHSSADVTRVVYTHGIKSQLSAAAESAATLVRGPLSAPGS